MNSAGAGFPNQGINPGHIHLQLPAKRTYIYLGGNATDINNWSEIDLALLPDLFSRKIDWILMSQYDSVIAAVNAAAGKTLVLDVAVTLDIDTTIPITTSLYPLYPGSINCNGKILTINMLASYASLYQWLLNFTAGKLLFGDSATDIVYGAWTGAFPTSSASANLLALQVALASRTYGNRVKLGWGVFNIDNLLNIGNSGSILEGVTRSMHDSNYATVLHNTGTSDAVYITANFGAGLKNMQITGNSLSRYGVNINGTLWPILDNLMIGNYTSSTNTGHGSHGLRLNGSVYYGDFKNVTCRNNYGKNLYIEGGANYNEFDNCQFQDAALDGVHIVSGYSNVFRHCDISTNGSGIPGTHYGNIIAAAGVPGNPYTLTATNHSLYAGQKIIIHGHVGSTPDINDIEYTCTVTGVDTFTIPVNVTVAGNSGLVTGVGGRGIRISGALNGYISTSSIANPTLITTPTPHGLVNSDQIIIQNHVGSTPNINQTIYAITYVSPTSFTIPVNVTVAGTGGTWIQLSSNGQGTIFDSCNYEVNGYDNEIVQANTPHGNTRLRDFTGDNIYAHFLVGNANIVENLFGSSGRVTFESNVNFSMVMLANAESMFQYINNGGGYNRVIGGQNVFGVASQAAFPMPSFGEQVNVSGTNNITSITGGGGAYRTVHLIFSGILTVTHGNNIKLASAANFVTQANSVLTLLFDTNNWFEVARKV